jgi:PBP1b-binding outer membrane lipoprotein LpoB
MHTKLARIGLILSVTAFAVGCNQQPAQTAAPAAAPAPVAAGPDATIMTTVHALRGNNIAALLDNALPPPALAKIKADWNKEMTKDPVTDEERRKFAEQMTG